MEKLWNHDQNLLENKISSGTNPVSHKLESLSLREPELRGVADQEQSELIYERPSSTSAESHTAPDKSISTPQARCLSRSVDDPGRRTALTHISKHLSSSVYNDRREQPTDHNGTALLVNVCSVRRSRTRLGKLGKPKRVSQGQEESREDDDDRESWHAAKLENQRQADLQNQRETNSIEFQRVQAPEQESHDALPNKNTAHCEKNHHDPQNSGNISTCPPESKIWEASQSPHTYNTTNHAPNIVVCSDRRNGTPKENIESKGSGISYNEKKIKKHVVNIDRLLAEDRKRNSPLNEVMPNTPAINSVLRPVEKQESVRSNKKISTRNSRRDAIQINGICYRKLALLGKGGSSKVYKVIDPSNSKIYAVKKVFLDQTDRSIISGYRNEILLLKKLKGHKRIIQLFDAEIIEEKNQILMLMECGEIDLAHLLQKESDSPIGLNFVRLYWEQMLEAVDAVHQQNIVHSDLKPANFLLVEGSLKLIDFGIAKAIGNDTTNIHRDTQVGTINYMSPEALSETDGGLATGVKTVKCGRASDVWSLGCILYQMIYGKTPFSHLSMVQKISAIPDEKCKIEFSVNSQNLRGNTNVSGDLLRTLKMCLLRNQKQRPSIPDLLSDPFLHPELISKSVYSSDESSPITQMQLRLLLEHVMELKFQEKEITPAMIDSLSKEAFESIRMAR